MAAFIVSQRAEHAVPQAISCRALGVSQAWFYTCRDRPPPAHVHRAELAAAIAAVFTDSHGTYGSPRVALELCEQGRRVSTNTIAKIMAEDGLVARPRRRRRGLTRQGARPAAPDLVGRNFAAQAPDQLWCGDLTEIDTDEGRLSLASTQMTLRPKVPKGSLSNAPSVDGRDLGEVDQRENGRSSHRHPPLESVPDEDRDGRSLGTFESYTGELAESPIERIIGSFLQAVRIR